MRAALRSSALLLAFITAASTADPVVEELFQQARTKVLDNARRMPRYVCVENVMRSQYDAAGRAPLDCQAEGGARKRARGALVRSDRLRLDVAVVEGGEIFSWAGAGKFETHEVDKLVGGGVSGSGEFGTFLMGVFGKEPDAIRYAGRRNDAALFEYNVPTERSGYRYRSGGPARTIGFHGTFSLDPADGDLEQLVVDADQFTQGEPVCHVRHVMDYQRVKIGSGEFILPEVSTMDVLYRNGTESLNETRYSDCREYVGESTIRFDDVEAGPGSTASKALQPLPPKTRLQVGLARPIDTQTASAGDEVIGVVLRNSGKEGPAAHVNDRLHGRIVRLEHYMAQTPRWIVGIRFDTIERGSAEPQPVSLRPLDDGERSGQRKPGTLPPGAVDKPEGAGLFIFTERGNVVLDQGFHSEWETR